MLDVKLILGGISGLLASFLVANSANAGIILDHSPGTFGSSTFKPGTISTWENQRLAQHWADNFSFGTNTAVDGMDIYSIPSFGAVGDSVSIQLWADNSGAPGALISEFGEKISTIDLEGARGDLNRKHADFTTPLNLLAGVTYWIGMSGLVEFGQQGLGDPGAPQDGSMARFTPDGFDRTRSEWGDMAFRLHGKASVPESTTFALLGLGLAALGIASVLGRTSLRV